MIEIGYNQVQEKHVADSNSNAREDAHEAKKVYVGNKLAHVHVNDNTEFALRQTLNGYIHEDNDLYARVRSIRGNTKVWNQLVNTSTYTNIITDTRTYVNLRFANTTTTPIEILINENISSPIFIKQIVTPTYTDTYRLKHNGSISDFNIYTIELIANHKYYITANVLSTDPTTVGGVSIKDMVAIDLTLIYGTGNEPTTVAEFEADFQQWFGRPIGAEPYDAGSLIPFQATGLKSTGFNLWDEEWEVGIYNSDGDKTSNINAIRSTNKIKVLPNTSYSVSCGQEYTSGLIVRFFRNSGVTSITANQSHSTFTTPTDCYEISFCTFIVDNITTYNHDICINLSNPTLNGTYVPYKATTVPIPVTTLTGKQSESSTSDVIFPDGMKKAGSVKDEIYVENGKTYAVKRVGSVDLGSMTWVYVNGETAASDFFSANFPTGGTPKEGMNSVTPKYAPGAVGRSTTGNKILYLTGSNNVRIRDISYTDATTFASAMSGVMLYYELATPIVYEVDNYTLPLYYLANGTGTEEIVSTATTAPADMDIEYRLRQRVRLVDMGTPGVLWADSDIDITKPDGFCDSPFTYDKSFFSWGNVVGHNPISNTAFDYDWGGVNQAKPWYEGQVYGSTPGSTLTGNIPADAQYDAAKAVLGGNWRMPSKDEYVALFNVCKFLEADGSDMDTSKTDKRVDMPDGNGSTVKGIYIESTVTGNRLFFSCSGYGVGYVRYDIKSNGRYWCSTQNTNRNGWLLNISSSAVTTNNSTKNLGLPIRPVFPISQ